ncbi:MAG: STAS-like domain-containing protein [Muribaculaceae bacterium]|nr:STAS-like domain-containing protein [Muribaculaceae bacterium]
MAESTKTIVKRIADWALRPGPRFREQGPKSGEEFYCTRLKEWYEEAVDKGLTLTIDLDGTDGYLTSFIDESFGRLVYDFGRDNVEKTVIVKSDMEPEWLSRLMDKTYPAWEKRRIEGAAPRSTVSTD